MSLLGRDRELADLVDRLGRRRLVTVVGPGGVGKTTLAREAARHVVDRFPLGTRFVDLARVDDGDAVAGNCAAQLGFTSFDALLSSPADQPALVIMDNCEHVLDGAAAVTDQLLASCEMPTVLATSRSPLDVPGETLLALAPLVVPAVDDPALSQAAVVQLFLARASDAGASVYERDLDAVVRLCARLDGLPLAVEIAAARAGTMTVAELLARVEEGLDVLDRPRFRGPSRHRSVTDLVAWSTDRLPPGAADLLERLAVLHGEFTYDTARRMGGPGRSFDEAFEELLHASLVSVDTTGDSTRFRLLDVVRRFAVARLQARGEFDDRYDEFVAEVVVRARHGRTGDRTQWGPASLRDAVERFDEVAAATRWCIERDHDPTRALTLCSSLLVVIEQGRAAEVLSLTRRVFDRWPAALPTRMPGAAEAIATLANAENLAGDPLVGLRLAREALDTVSPPALAAVTLRQAIGDCSVALGDPAAAARVYAEAAALARQLSLIPLALELELGRAQVRADMGEVDAALTTIDAVAAEAVASGATLTAVWASAAQAWISLRTRRPVDSVTVIEASLAACREASYPNGIAANLRSLAFCRLLGDDLAGAVDALESLRDQIVEQRSLANVRMLVDAAAAIAHRAGHPTWERLAATVDTLPPATLVAARGFALVPLPETRAPALSAGDALVVVRSLTAGLREQPRPHPADLLGSDPRMRRSGDVWELSFAGRTVTVRTSRGIETIARLVADPGREIHCLDLMGAGVEQHAIDEVIDGAARRSYESRIRELQVVIEEAEADNDYARGELARDEFDALVDALSSALGHGGKTRRIGATAERARSAVTHRVRSAIRVLHELHEPLARHLNRSVSTGVYCSYQPEQPTTWHVTI
ncbi:MAG TPA: AAA family ATPase [Microlunatus sp.]